MLKKVINILKRIVFSCVLLYGYNLIMMPMNFIIPINFITIGTISVLGVPALFSFIAIQYFIF